METQALFGASGRAVALLSLPTMPGHNNWRVRGRRSVGRAAAPEPLPVADEQTGHVSRVATVPRPALGFIRGETMSWSLACGDVMRGCTAVLSGAIRDDVMATVAQHAASAHDLNDVDLETATLLRGKIMTA